MERSPGRSHSRIRTCRGPDLRETRDLLTEAVATLDRLSNAQVSTQPATNAAAGQPDHQPPDPRTRAVPVQPPSGPAARSDQRSSSHNQGRHTTLSQCDRVRSERLQLFRPRPFSWSSSSFSGHGRGSRHSSYKNKRRVATWQHDFVCLARMDTKSPPSPLERGILLQAGLGANRIIFADCHDSEIFHSEILEAFPKLRDAGG